MYQKDDMMPEFTITGLLVLLLVRGSIQHQTTCATVHQESLQSLPGCVVTRDEFSQRHVTITCEDNVGTIMTVVVLQEISNQSNQRNLTYCTGLRKIEVKSGRKSWYVSFDSNQVTGVMTVGKACWEEGSLPCNVNIQILYSVWQIPAFHYTAETDEFWNFTSPLFTTEHGWLQGVGVSECSVEYRWLSGLENTSVSALDIDRGKWRTFDVHLPSLPTLKRLVVKRCGLINFDESYIAAVSNIEELVISGNTFPGIPRGISQLKKLKLLDISRNLGNTFTVPTDEMKELQQLEYLDLGTVLAINSFSILTSLPLLPKLKYLNLTRCKLGTPDEVETDPFINFPSLEVLDLSRNTFTRWNSKFLQGRTLKYLDFTRTGLTETPVLLGCNISILNLSLNELAGFTNLAYYGTFVNYLDVSMNNISKWNDRNVFSSVDQYPLNYVWFTTDNSTMKYNGLICSGCAVLSNSKVHSWTNHVDLSGNQIYAVTDVMLDSLSVIKTLDLEGNPFDCTDCSMLNFVEWMRTEHKVNSSAMLVCDSPHNEPQEKVIDSKSYEAICFPPDITTAMLAMGPVLAVCLVIIVLFLGVGYTYRTEISYTFHLFRIKHGRRGDEYEDFVYDAFICYSGKDRVWVMRMLVPALENSTEKYRLCLHDRDFALGTMIVENIAHCIDKSRRVIIVLSNHFVKSKWCQWELDMANHKSFEDASCFLILIQLEILDRKILPRHLKLLMDTRTYLEWPSKELAQTTTDVVFKRLKDALGPSIRQVVEPSTARLSIKESV